MKVLCWEIFLHIFAFSLTISLSLSLHILLQIMYWYVHLMLQKKFIKISFSQHNLNLKICNSKNEFLGAGLFLWELLMPPDCPRPLKTAPPPP